MSKTNLELVVAEEYANAAIAHLSPFCERIEIAGSVRRQKAEVGDIEIVAIPKMTPALDIFGEQVGTDSALDSFDYSILGKVVKGGSRYKQIEMAACNLDLFIVLPPAQWGVIFAIRTGPWEYSKRLVTPRKHGGWLPSCYAVRNGGVYNGDTLIEMPQEADFFALLGYEFVPAPHERN